MVYHHSLPIIYIYGSMHVLGNLENEVFGVYIHIYVYCNNFWVYSIHSIFRHTHSYTSMKPESSPIRFLLRRRSAFSSSFLDSRVLEDLCIDGRNCCFNMCLPASMIATVFNPLPGTQREAAGNAAKTRCFLLGGSLNRKS